MNVDNDLRMKVLKLLSDMTDEIDEFEGVMKRADGVDSAQYARANTIRSVLLTYHPRVLELASNIGCPVRTFERKKP